MLLEIFTGVEQTIWISAFGPNEFRNIVQLLFISVILQRFIWYMFYYCHQHCLICRILLGGIIYLLTVYSLHAHWCELVCFRDLNLKLKGSDHKKNMERNDHRNCFKKINNKSKPTTLFLYLFNGLMWFICCSYCSAWCLLSSCLMGACYISVKTSWPYIIRLNVEILYRTDISNPWIISPNHCLLHLSLRRSEPPLTEMFSPKTILGTMNTAIERREWKGYYYNTILVCIYVLVYLFLWLYCIQCHPGLERPHT